MKISFRYLYDIFIKKIERFFIVAALLLTTLCVRSPAAIPLTSGNSDEILTSIEDAVSSNDKTKGTVDDLVRALDAADTDVRVKERAAWALGKLRVASATPNLIEAAHQKGLLVRSAALNSLVQLRAKTAIPVFIDAALNDPILTLRQRSVLALGMLRAANAIPNLVTLSSDAREEIRGAAALALGAVHSKKNDATQILADMKKDSSPYVQERARRALEEIRGTRVQLKEQLNSPDPDIRLFAALAYQQRGKSSDLKLLAAAANSDADEDVRDELTAAIQAVKSRVAKKPAHAAKHKSKKAKSSTSSPSGTPKKG